MNISTLEKTGKNDLKWIDFLGCPISVVTMEDALEKIDAFIKSDKPHQIIVVNAAKIVKMDMDSELREIVLSADMVCADGTSIVWASKLLGSPLPEKVTGIDLMHRLIERANLKNYSIFFLGATQQVLNDVIVKVKKEYPRLKIAGWRNGYFKPEEDNEVVEQIRNAKPDILFIAMGTPKKEKWVHTYLDALNVPVCHGVGGSFDVFAGYVKRAPLWMQDYGLEWFYRFIQEPRRMWKRYLVTNTLFIYKVLKEKLSITFIKKKSDRRKNEFK